MLLLPPSPLPPLPLLAFLATTRRQVARPAAWPVGVRGRGQWQGGPMLGAGSAARGGRRTERGARRSTAPRRDLIRGLVAANRVSCSTRSPMTGPHLK